MDHFISNFENQPIRFILREDNRMFVCATDILEAIGEVYTATVEDGFLLDIKLSNEEAHVRNKIEFCGLSFVAQLHLMTKLSNIGAKDLVDHLMTKNIIHLGNFNEGCEELALNFTSAMRKNFQ